MGGSKYEGYQAALRVIRRNPGLSDAEVAAEAGIHPMMISETVLPARRDAETERQAAPSVTTTLEPRADA